MALPSPLPDNPARWDGWRTYTSPNPYERLCLDYDQLPSNEQIEEHCRQLLVWWQKKLPLKNQPSNPIAQLLRAGLDEAPRYLVEARTDLLNPESRERVDERLRAGLRQTAMVEFNKFLGFALGDGILTKEAERNLYQVGARAGLTIDDMRLVVDSEIARVGARRAAESAPAEVSPVDAAARPAPVLNSHAPLPVAGPAAEEFMRMLKLTKLDEAEMTDDQRDALCNMGESLGLTGGQAEDVIDAYLEWCSEFPLGLPGTGSAAPAKAAPMAPRPSVSVVKPVAKTPAISVVEAGPAPSVIDTTPLARSEEKSRHPDFQTATGITMIYVPSGAFQMGSVAPDAGPNEGPVARVGVRGFYMSRFPVTNAIYEKFDATHRSRRMASASDEHPVVYVSSLDAIKFCKWLSTEERRRFRLPSEAEWEYAARGLDGRSFPWGELLTRGDLANFADKNTSFAWRDPNVDDGYAETSPVGHYPRGASPFGIEDMAGNVWEWCADFFDAYQSRERINPAGPASGGKRVYRGGSWKSRASNLRGSARGSNLPTFSSNDVGFRIVCEAEP